MRYEVFLCRSWNWSWVELELELRDGGNDEFGAGVGGVGGVGVWGGMGKDEGVDVCVLMFDVGGWG